MTKVSKIVVCFILTICIVFNTTYNSYATPIFGSLLAGLTAVEVAKYGATLIAAVAGVGLAQEGFEHADDIMDEFEKAFEEAESIYKPESPKNPRNQFKEILKKLKQGMKEIEIPDELWGCVTSILGKKHEEVENVGSPPTAMDGMITGSIVENSVKHTSYNFKDGYIWMNSTLSDSCYVFLSAETDNRGDVSYYYTVMTMDKNASVICDSNLGKLESPSNVSPLKWAGYTYYSLGGTTTSNTLTFATGIDFFSFRRMTADDYVGCMLGNVPSDFVDLRSKKVQTNFNVSSYMKDALKNFNANSYDIVNNNTSYVENNQVYDNRVISIPDNYEDLIKQLNQNLISLEDFLNNFNVTPVFKTEDTNNDNKIDSHDKVTDKSRDKNGVPVNVNNKDLSAKFNLSPYSYPQLKNFFPFCLPWDMYKFFIILCEEPKAPVFEWTVPLSAMGGDLEDYNVKVDLSPFDELAKTCRKLMLFTFCFGLIFATKKFI